jgi:hypothetical protein
MREFIMKFFRDTWKTALLFLVIEVVYVLLLKTLFHTSIGRMLTDIERHSAFQ